MIVKIKHSSGNWDEEVDGSMGVLDLKALLSCSVDIEAQHQRLIRIHHDARHRSTAVDQRAFSKEITSVAVPHYHRLRCVRPQKQCSAG